MAAEEDTLQKLRREYAEDIERLAQDVQNGFSFSKVSFIYSRLKKMGPWNPEDLTMELFLELDMMRSALAVEYARIFVGGGRKINRSKIPPELRHTHDAIMDLRNTRYAHDDTHKSVKNFVELEIEGNEVRAKPGANIGIVFGAPLEWEELIEWLGEYLFSQWKSQLKRLTDITGFDWTSSTGEPPSWLKS